MLSSGPGLWPVAHSVIACVLFMIALLALMVKETSAGATLSVLGSASLGVAWLAWQSGQGQAWWNVLVIAAVLLCADRSVKRILQRMKGG
jgi:hypothetical protein